MTADVVIIGAGAAGIGAGLALQARGVPFVILEAQDRIGGRAYTDKNSLPGHWDQGCGWLHCADVNPLVDWADRLGTIYEREDRPNRLRGRGVFTALVRDRARRLPSGQDVASRLVQSLKLA